MGNCGVLGLWDSDSACAGGGTEAGGGGGGLGGPGGMKKPIGRNSCGGPSTTLGRCAGSSLMHCGGGLVLRGGGVLERGLGLTGTSSTSSSMD